MAKEQSEKLFDDKPFIVKSVNHNRGKWIRAFQKYCDSDEIREESSLNGINACGYGIQCEECKFEEANQCSKAMIRYCENKGTKIDYSNTSIEYFRELLGEQEWN